MDQFLFYAMPIVFILGILAIAFEDLIKINKSATALVMCVVLWGLLFARMGISAHSPTFTEFLLHHQELNDVSESAQLSAFLSSVIVKELGEVSTTLFFVLCSMLIIALVDKFGGFQSLISIIHISYKRKLFVWISFMAFALSALIDNLAASVLLLALLNRLVPNHTDRMKFACMIIIACNAGGAWSPVGDVTTLLLWTQGRISIWGQISSVFLPSLVNMLLPLLVATFTLFKKDTMLREIPQKARRDVHEVPNYVSTIILILGLLSIALVPVWQIIFDIPPFLGVLIGLGSLWVLTDIYLAWRTKRTKGQLNLDGLSVVSVLRKADMPTFFYFTGILLSVSALVVGGQLFVMQSHLDKLMYLTDYPKINSLFLPFTIGLMSSFTDNVALVAAILGVYPVDYSGLLSMVLDGSFWTFLAYCGVTGGSLLIIGSATGVTVMGLQKISFGYYFKRFTPLALLGYIGGGLVYYLLNIL